MNNKKLKKIRKQIDLLDKKLLDLIKIRTELVKKVITMSAGEYVIIQ